jgi:NAD(P)-dependent dehydrogenase (short-subunit alcohol dehydrogenase family)
VRLEGKVAVVTGGGSGIGRSACLLFAREGSRVLIADIAGEKAQHTAIEICRQGGIVQFIAEDISIEKSAERIIGQALELWDRVDVLVNCAASFEHKPVEKASYKDWEKVLSVNVMGTSFCCKYAVEATRKQRGGARS